MVVLQVGEALGEVEVEVQLHGSSTAPAVASVSTAEEC